jgi:quinol monooxygenase YgiN
LHTEQRQHEATQIQEGQVQEKLNPEGEMFIVHVFVHVKTDSVAAFRDASVANARKSILEPGIARFDVIQQADDPTRFILIEVYRTPEDAARHKETEHYAIWRDAVAELMAEPRYSIKFANCFPDENGWD